MNCICKAKELSLVHEYKTAPVGETHFPFIKTYQRRLMRCIRCGHLLNQHDYNFEDLYNGDYVSASYQGDIAANFEKIMALPVDKSDNVGRVAYIIDFCKRYFGSVTPHVLDVGSGTCVFLYKLFQETSWPCLALDPDPKQAQHARNVGIQAVQSDIFFYNPTQRYDLITLNKVIEHVEDPSTMLAHAAGLLTAKGLLYIEVPDGPEALKDSPYREEFFIEHYHAFSVSSIVHLVESLNMRVLNLERIKEPSSKYTLRLMVNKIYEQGNKIC